MGFEIMGLRVWDLSQPFGYFEAFSGIAIVLLCALITFGLLRYFRPSQFNLHKFLDFHHLTDSYKTLHKM